MAMINFNGSEVEPADDYSVVPDGSYNAQVVKTDVVRNGNDTGDVLKTQYKIIDGQYKGRIVFDQFNMSNPSDQCVEISRRKLKTLCDAIGKPDGVSDSDELKGIPMVIKVVIIPASVKYKEKNEAKYFNKYEGASLGSTEGSTPDVSSSTSQPAWMGGGS